MQFTSLEQVEQFKSDYAQQIAQQIDHAVSKGAQYAEFWGTKDGAFIVSFDDQDNEISRAVFETTFTATSVHGSMDVEAVPVMTLDGDVGYRVAGHLTEADELRFYPSQFEQHANALLENAGFDLAVFKLSISLSDFKVYVSDSVEIHIKSCINVECEGRAVSFCHVTAWARTNKNEHVKPYFDFTINDAQYQEYTNQFSK